MTLPAFPFYENTLLFGADQTPGLLAFELEGSDAIRIYRREGAGTTTSVEPFSPFLLIADPDLLRDWKGDADVSPLDGLGFYRWLARLPSWAAALRARDQCQKASKKTSGAPDAPYRFLNDAVHQFLLLTGKTSFLGMAFPALRRLALDIEVLTGEGFDFPHAARESDRIIAIALADSTGWEHVISGREHSEPEMLELCSRDGHPVFAMSRGASAALTETQRRRVTAYAEVVLAPIDTIERLGGGGARCMIAEIFLPRRETSSQNDSTPEAASENIIVTA